MELDSSNQPGEVSSSQDKEISAFWSRGMGEGERSTEGQSRASCNNGGLWESLGTWSSPGGRGSASMTHDKEIRPPPPNLGSEYSSSGEEIEDDDDDEDVSEGSIDEESSRDDFEGAGLQSDSGATERSGADMVSMPLRARIASLERRVSENNVSLEGYRQRLRQLEASQQAQPQLTEDEQTEFRSTCKTDLCVSDISGKRHDLSFDEIRAMDSQRLVQLWTEYTKTLASRLVVYDAFKDRDTSVVEGVGASICQLVREELIPLILRAAHGNMRAVTEMTAKANLDENWSVGFPEEPSSRWQAISGLLQLSEDQKNHFRHAWHTFDEAQGKLFEKRLSVHRSLRETDSSYSVDTAELFRNISEMRTSIRDEHVLIHNFMQQWFSEILDPAQAARCIVMSHPFYTDHIWIAKQLASSLDSDKAPVSDAGEVQ